MFQKCKTVPQEVMVISWSGGAYQADMIISFFKSRGIVCTHYPDLFVGPHMIFDKNKHPVFWPGMYILVSDKNELKFFDTQEELPDLTPI